MLNIRRRKGSPYWYVRGVVALGTRTVTIDEHSTKTIDRGAAQAYAARLYTETLEALAAGKSPERREITFAAAALAWVKRHDTAYARARLRKLDAFFGGALLREIDAEAFAQFCREHLPGRHPNTLEAYRIALIGIFKTGGCEPPKIRSFAVRARQSGRQWLTQEEADRLIASYIPHVAVIATVARYNGLRAGELVRLRIRDVDLGRNTLHIAETKSGRARTVPMHPKTRAAVEQSIAAWAFGGRLHGDAPLFANRKGVAYHDTRGVGGNPLSAAHRSACKRAKIEGFRWHDWRHHYGHHFIRAGGDIRILSELMGHSSLDMTRRYSAVDMDHAAAIQARVA